MIGGSKWVPFVNDVNNYLMSIDTANYDWATVSGTPDITILMPEHCLARDLPITYDFVDNKATFYMLRITDTDVEVVAMNGDGQKAIVTKSIGEGTFICFINSPYEGYYTNADDYEYLKTFIRNTIECYLPKPIGGAITPINQVSLLIPYLLLGCITALMIIGTAFLTRKQGRL
ncbi:MAG: hypothetical protein QXL67_02280 [Candidatus Bathyarchaeia archaeon]